ncbi:hypothetical protein [Streptomyces acidicola]|uniref:hypothetical protein n=1 Tax=Streptomyces acidicola TaxID=2596892 RepID=UPI00128DE899|nr:hypothetical protein [Streptomyces acidicola]
MTVTLHICRYCDGLITDEAPGRAFAYEHSMSGRGREVWAHDEHAHLVKPDLALLLLLAHLPCTEGGPAVRSIRGLFLYVVAVAAPVLALMLARKPN